MWVHGLLSQPRADRIGVFGLGHSLIYAHDLDLCAHRPQSIRQLVPRVFRTRNENALAGCVLRKMLQDSLRDVFRGNVIDTQVHLPQRRRGNRPVDTMLKSSDTYAYDTADQLVFELRLRDSIVSAARLLARSGMQFRVFRESIANPDYWSRTDEGGFRLKPGVKPSDAILDIYKHGFQYGTECSTAMLIVYYRAMLDAFPEPLFDRVYNSIYLYNWENIDRDLAVMELDNITDELPGDARYFVNPDVDPLHPEWQGENVFYLGDGKYYGHGIGVTDAEHIVRALNDSRREGATQEAYLQPGAKRQDYKKLYGMLKEYENASS